jgi:hypothetical protein
MLVNDGTGYGADPILAPYDTGQLADYTVEARIRMTRKAGTVPTAVGLATRRSADGGGYSAAVRDGYPASIGYIGAGPWSWLVEGQPYIPDDGWHTYALPTPGNQKARQWVLRRLSGRRLTCDSRDEALAADAWTHHGQHMTWTLRKAPVCARTTPSPSYAAGRSPVADGACWRAGPTR